MCYKLKGYLVCSGEFTFETRSKTVNIKQEIIKETLTRSFSHKRKKGIHRDISE